jgi:recombination associated protein RdgC
MPIQRGSATFSRFRVARAGRTRKDLAEQLRAHAFEPLDLADKEERAEGFVELGDRDAVEFSPGAVHLGDVAVFSFRIDEVKIPSAAVRTALEAWSRAFERENGRPPGRKEKADAKGELKHSLRSRYPLATRTVDVSWDRKSDVLEIWAGSRKAVDEVEAALEKALSLELVQITPAAVAARLELAVEALQPSAALSIEVDHGA